LLQAAAVVVMGKRVKGTQVAVVLVVCVRP
jgi:hypothetical protein